jgi:prepilin-type N-terminal cleavage/methylation domain-containing protein
MKNLQKGFTLVELVIVIVIVGILSIVAVPIYRGYIERARFTEAMTNLRAIADANTLYFVEHGSWCTDIRELPIQLEGEVILKDDLYRIQNRNFIYAAAGDGSYDTIATVNREPYHQRYWISFRSITGRYGNTPKLGDYGVEGDVYSTSKYKAFDKSMVDRYKQKFPIRTS